MSGKLVVAFCGVFLVILTACSSVGVTPTLAFATSEQAPTPTPTVAPTSTLRPTETLSPTTVPTETTVPTPTMVLTYQGPGPIVCPILLYHHIGDTDSKNVYISEYFVGADQFTEEMQTLYDLGFRTITVTQLVEAIRVGSILPEKPVVITFDDGYDNTYTVAYPIMKHLGFIGITYVPAKVIDVPGYQSAEQLKDLVANGWEVGSHSYSHPFLTQSSNLSLEIGGSKTIIERLIGSPVSSFAYPYGDANADIINRVSASYSSGAGLGTLVMQRQYYFLSRWVVFRDTPITDFIGYLSP